MNGTTAGTAHLTVCPFCASYLQEVNQSKLPQKVTNQTAIANPN